MGRILRQTKGQKSNKLNQINSLNALSLFGNHKKRISHFISINIFILEIFQILSYQM